MATARDSDSTSSPSFTDNALERRVAALECERELLMERYARQLEFGNERLRTLMSGRPDPASPLGPSTTTATPSTATPGIASASATLARVLARVESERADGERLAAGGAWAAPTMQRCR